MNIYLSQQNLLKRPSFPHWVFLSPLPNISVQFSRWVVSNSLHPHGLQHARLPCPSPIPKSCSNSCPSSHLILCHPFSFCLQSFPASGSFPMSQFFASGGQSIGVSASASVLPVDIQDWFSFRVDWLSWFPLGLTGLIARYSVQSSSVAQLCPTLCDPMDGSKPGISWLYMPKFYSGLSIMFHLLISLLLCQSHTVFIAMAL